MKPNRSISLKILAVLAGGLLASCGGGDSADVGAGAGGGGGAGAGPPAGGSTGVATLSWTAPAQNMDGSAVTNLAGYRIYHGTSASSLTTMVQVSNPGASIYVVEGLPAGTRYFAVSAYNSAGVESDRSAVASKTIL